MKPVRVEATAVPGLGYFAVIRNAVAKKVRRDDVPSVPAVFFAETWEEFEARVNEIVSKHGGQVIEVIRTAGGSKE